jgi:hypothetical protein
VVVVEFEVDERPVEAAFDRLTNALDDEFERCFTRAGEAIAGIAKRTHKFRNHTEDLEGSIEGVPATGTLSAGTLQAAAVAGEDYASFVEGGTSRSRAYPFMEPAGALYEPLLEHDAADAFERAFRRAGWR